MQHPFLQQVFKPLYQQPCWNVKPSYGSSLTLELGEPHLRIREPTRSHAPSFRVRQQLARRLVVVRGAWHLWIYGCDWRVTSKGKVIGDRSSARRIMRAAAELDGQALVSVTVNAQNDASVFTFDLGGQLETTPYDTTSEQWLLYEPSSYVLTIRADGSYAHARGDTPHGQEQWIALT